MLESQDPAVTILPFLSCVISGEQIILLTSAPIPLIAQLVHGKHKPFPQPSYYRF